MTETTSTGEGGVQEAAARVNAWLDSNWKYVSDDLSRDLRLLAAHPEPAPTVEADAWDEGYQRGLRDAEQDVQHGADNPYRFSADDTGAGERECGVIPPNVGGPVPCHLPSGHDGEHFSTSGCAGSEIRWSTPAPDATTPPDGGGMEALAQIIWRTSRADEGTISATGANIIARALLTSDWLKAHDAARAAEVRAEVGEEVARAAVIDATHLARQREWSKRTFGPGSRLHGVLDHIRKELKEIEADPTDVTEWIDVVILALDGAWRAGWEPQQIIDAIKAKQARNEVRTWPDWRTAAPDKAIEHTREAQS